MNDTTKQYLYTCSANSIQGYLFGDEKLKAVVGASLLVENLPDCLIEASKQAFIQNPPKVINQAAGMVGLLFEDEQDALDFARIAPVLLHRHAPSLDCTQAVTTVETGKLGSALDSAAKLRRAGRNLPAISLPEATGVVEKSRQTGEPACRREDEEPTSASSFAKIDSLKADKGTLGLLRKLLPDDVNLQKDRDLHDCWPQNFDHFTQGEGEYLAMVHADVNGLGKLVKKFLEGLDQKSDLAEAVDDYKKFSTGLTNCAVTALKSALVGLIKKYKDAEIIPFRPLVAAGDDVTYVIHARDAFTFTETVLRELQSKAETLFNDLNIENDLSAAAGIAFIKPHYPFSRAYELAESLCAHTKKATGRKYSALAFHRLTTSLIDDYPDFIKKGMTTPQQVVLTMNPYAVGQTQQKGVPTLDALKKLAEACAKLPRGKLRGLVDTLRNQPNLVDRDWKRLKEVAAEKQQDDLQAFEKALKPFTHDSGLIHPKPSKTTDEESENIEDTPQEPSYTPLFDALEWLTLNKAEIDETTNTTPPEKHEIRD